MVVGLALLMAEMEGVAAHLEVERRGVGHVRVPVLRGPDQLLEPELAPVDSLVEPGRPHVSVEPLGDVLMRDHSRWRPSALSGLGLEGPDAEDMIHVPVAEHRSVEPVGPPGAHCLVDLLGDERRA